MAQIGSLIASSNQTFNLDFLPQFVLVDSPALDNPVTNISIVTGGQQLMSLTDAARIRAISKFDAGGMLGGSVKVPMYLSLGLGRVNKQTTINMVNGAATTPAVFAASVEKSNVARTAVETSINASANGSFQNFEGLFFLGTNVLRATITFNDGFSDEFSLAELQAMYAKTHITDADGLLAGLTVIDGTGIDMVTIYATSGGNVTVAMTSFVQF